MIQIPQLLNIELTNEQAATVRGGLHVCIKRIQALHS